MASTTSQRNSPVGIAIGELASAIDATLSPLDADVFIHGVQQDSRQVGEGDLFVALRGASSDGARFVEQAQRQGAVAVLRDRLAPLDTTLPQLQVNRPRWAMARAAALTHGEPTKKLSVVGITGTNGKTTTSHILEVCLQAAGARPGVVGTLGNRFETWSETTQHTSPEADDVQRIARAMLDRGASHLVMEVSSIALAVERISQVKIDVAVFTNLTQDHLDHHGTMDAYAAAKASLFDSYEARASALFVDDVFGAQLADKLQNSEPSSQARKLFRVSAKPRSLDAAAEAAIDVFPSQVTVDSAGIRMTVCSPVGQANVDTPLTGDFNVANILCAAAVVVLLGLDLGVALAALNKMQGVPGRLERCHQQDDDIAAFVDYAHTPDALRRVLAGLNAQKPAGAQLWCVFGCGGDRDRAKRPVMGEVGARGSDVLVITNDNPRSENPQQIAASIAERLVDIPHWVQLDRKRAIVEAVLAAAPGDVVLVAGKGHETYQIIGETTTVFDDRVELREALAIRRAGAVS